jgi:hypothetical protein
MLIPVVKVKSWACIPEVKVFEFMEENNIFSKKKHIHLYLVNIKHKIKIYMLNLLEECKIGIQDSDIKFRRKMDEIPGLTSLIKMHLGFLIWKKTLFSFKLRR